MPKRKYCITLHEIQKFESGDEKTAKFLETFFALKPVPKEIIRIIKRQYSKDPSFFLDAASAKSTILEQYRNFKYAPWDRKYLAHMDLVFTMFGKRFDLEYETALDFEIIQEYDLAIGRALEEILSKSTFSEIELKVFAYITGLQDKPKKSYKSTSLELGISVEQVRELYKKVVRKIKHIKNSYRLNILINFFDTDLSSTNNECDIFEYFSDTFSSTYAHYSCYSYWRKYPCIVFLARLIFEKNTLKRR